MTVHYLTADADGRVLKAGVAPTPAAARLQARPGSTAYLVDSGAHLNTEDIVLAGERTAAAPGRQNVPPGAIGLTVTPIP